MLSKEFTGDVAALDFIPSYKIGLLCRGKAVGCHQL